MEGPEEDTRAAAAGSSAWGGRGLGRFRAHALSAHDEATRLGAYLELKHGAVVLLDAA